MNVLLGSARARCSKKPASRAAPLSSALSASQRCPALALPVKVASAWLLVATISA